MPVQTRSAAKRQAAAESTTSRQLVSEDTIIEITVSATGEGKHIRWIRPSKKPGQPEEVISPDLNNDPRFKTPAPSDKPTSPPKLQRRSLRRKPTLQSPSGDKILLNFAKDEVDEILHRASGRDLYSEFYQLVDNSDAPETTAHDLGSPLFNGGRDSRWLATFSSRLQGFDTPSPPDLEKALGRGVDAVTGVEQQTATAGRRAALGPHGTILIGSDGEPLFTESLDE